MKTKTIDFEVLVPNAAGTDIQRANVQVPLRWDEELRDWLMTPEAHDIIENKKAAMIGLLVPAQLKELRERYELSQKEAGELFQVGGKSWNRWESGEYRPSRSINLLIRALYEGEISINYLLKRAGKPERGTVPLKLWEGARYNWYSGRTKLSKPSTKVRLIRGLPNETCEQIQKWIAVINEPLIASSKPIYLADRKAVPTLRVDKRKDDMEIA